MSSRWAAGARPRLNEWELTIFAKVVQRVTAASLVRGYISGASADFFEHLFDELQRMKLMFTGRPIPFKKFVRGGNLLVTNLDMDTAQVLGLCRSVLKFSDPKYSGIPKDTNPEDIAPMFIKICWRHAKEPVHDFRSLVSAADFAQLMDFVYIDSKEKLKAFSSFVYGLGVKKISDWWRHKEINEWIIPCFIKSQSRLTENEWDSTPSTTNNNEAQHHHTNTLAGVKLTPVEALERRRYIDQNTAEEIEMSLRTGILVHTNNEMSQRMSRNTQRQSATAQKAQDSYAAADLAHQLQLQIEAEAEKQRLSKETSKALKAQLKESKAKSGKARKADLTASSSGRVKAGRGRRASPSLPVQSLDIEDSPAAPTSSTAASELPAMELSNAQALAVLPFHGVDDILFDFGMYTGGVRTDCE
ncbi:hypothetical protein R3P38DRAFT_2800060 [Favolaschia claudopus]|uniref:Uncharacterized protein n=1 Tax=Favolaschia claudopus TaxID=2862362 RepID=A0AAW0A078_9AGAR